MDQVWLRPLGHDFVPLSHSTPLLVGELVRQELDLAVMFADYGEERDQRSTSQFAWLPPLILKKP